MEFIVEVKSNIVFFCIPLLDLANSEFQWCFTDGNAAKVITRCFTDLKDIDNIDWLSIESKDCRSDNADGDGDRIRKKHSEFLVKDFIPNPKIKTIAVYNSNTKKIIDTIVKKLNLNIKVVVKQSYYFNLS